MPDERVEIADEQEWVKLAAEGDERAYANLVIRHSPAVFRFLRRMLGNIQDAEDLTQETFFELYRHRGGLRKESNVLPYLFTIARRKAITLIRWRKVRWVLRPLAMETDEPLPHDSPNARDLLQAERVEQQLNRALLELKPEKRSVLILRFFEGLSYQELAEVMEKPEGTVKSIVFRAEQELRHKLGPIATEWQR